MSHELPNGWKWIRFGDATICRDGERIPLSREQRTLRQGEYDYYGASGVIDKIDDYLFDEPLLLIGEDGANLVNRSTPIAFIASGKYWVNNHAHVLDSLSVDCLRYFEVFINAIDLKPYITGTAQPKMNQAKMNSIPVPLPPLAEQKRIVEKVDELMALCDRYEAAQQTRDNLRQKLRGSAIASLMNAETDEELDAAWAFVRDNWHNLSQHPEDVNGLRQSALKLAFQGRLTQQSTETPSASELLKAIQQEQEEPVTKKNSRRKNLLNPLICPSIFDIPQSWEWTYLDFVCEQIGDIDHKMPQAVKQGVPFLSAKDLKDDGTLDFSAPKYISEEDYERLSRKIKPRKGDIVYSRIGAKLGKARLVEVDTTFLISYSCCLIRPKYQFINVRYLRYFLDSKLALEQAISSTQSIGVPDLGLGAIKQYKIPYPPLGEQKRIVAKVDELMQLCNQLEASLRQSQQRAESFAASAISHLTI
ncbi:restriction endonuclease subunit S [Microcoleus sp. FACHB-53]|nr:restriction endonuclease subunit S [Microcoleus sp. FACHB-53]